MYLTVPLPIAQTRVAKFHFVPLYPAQLPVQVKLLLPTNASWGHLKEKLATLTGCSSSNVSVRLRFGGSLLEALG